MASVKYLMRYGDQIGVHFDNGVVVMAYPTDTYEMWLAGPNGGIGPGTGLFVWPFDPEIYASSEYGPRGVDKFHEGIDLAPASDTPIPAGGDGIVDQRYYHANFGNLLIIDHGIMESGTHAGKRVKTLYAHMIAPSPLAPGVSTEAGVTIVGNVGNTGASFGPHLHWEIHVMDDGSGIVWNTNDDGGFRTAVDPRIFMAEYGGV